MRTKSIKGGYKEPATKSAEQALTSLMNLCARAEKSSGDARRLMARWRVPAESRDEVLNKLIEQRFIDDRRYAEAYINEKRRLSGWGERKITIELQRKGVNAEIINEKLEETEESAEIKEERLTTRLRRKMPSVKYKSAYELRSKLIRYALSLGYDYSLSSTVSQSLLSETECEEESEEWF